ncbi:hypothetical protein [Bacillus cereus]|uniref:hypothetical protein n=1 Tax=Bacillus cereus TaxID=1396 RepID=UPI001156BEC6|nr:hypothetical protein [Bacillus cereus]
MSTLQASCQHMQEIVYLVHKYYNELYQYQSILEAFPDVSIQRISDEEPVVLDGVSFSHYVQTTDRLVIFVSDKGEQPACAVYYLVGEDELLPCLVDSSYITDETREEFYLWVNIWNDTYYQLQKIAQVMQHKVYQKLEEKQVDLDKLQSELEKMEKRNLFLNAQSYRGVIPRNYKQLLINKELVTHE